MKLILTACILALTLAGSTADAGPYLKYSPRPSAVDFACMQRCQAAGSLYGYCLSVCSF